MFGGSLPALLGLGNGGSCSIASQPDRFNSDMEEQGGEAQAVLTLNLCCFTPGHELAARLLEGRLVFVSVAK